MFAERGIPREFRAGNMPFNCAEFHEFADKWEFSWKTASPHHPQGIWERSVQTVKQVLKKQILTAQTHVLRYLRTEHHHCALT